MSQLFVFCKMFHNINIFQNSALVFFPDQSFLLGRQHIREKTDDLGFEVE